MFTQTTLLPQLYLGDQGESKLHTADDTGSISILKLCFLSGATTNLISWGQKAPAKPRPYAIYWGLGARISSPKAAGPKTATCRLKILAYIFPSAVVFRHDPPAKRPRSMISVRMPLSAFLHSLVPTIEALKWHGRTLLGELLQLSRNPSLVWTLERKGFKLQAEGLFREIATVASRGEDMLLRSTPRPVWLLPVPVTASSLSYDGGGLGEEF
ncbi:hypothetical protein BCR41DRAFT_418953 [Lobosporangium transversale]|uniref:Uncharacterized protein n=1 Tax=Lobosporangium transversale TaxID=64571 RepID=A0A1Y2H0E2_9FUNG|nr:hypothetical protein BCR41DRAFT_418953 [Lobosporangium transversale]ORZ27985.1 hypothetical protein BCR41DRAFT_418953 [Lobosporangium transversale]|eukprot:XP_021885688.1 hypothetical protein BCR41DRAFT_418953 [Lobosporangium transversale]